MPTNRSKRTRNRKNVLTPTLKAFLLDEPMPEDGNEWEWLSLKSNAADINTGLTTEDHWTMYGEKILEQWIEENPGTRPASWWKFQAPRWDDPFKGWAIHGTLPEPRKQLGGSGIQDFEKFNVVPAFEYGIPRLVDVVESDPPIFESQSAYLKRHGLLLPGEDGDFEPEIITEYSAFPF